MQIIKKISMWEVLPAFALKIWIKMKNTTQQPIKREWIGPIDKRGTYGLNVHCVQDSNLTGQMPSLT